MDDTKQVAQDAVRAAYGDDVADRLEWAATLVRHSVTVRRALETVDPDNEECLGRAGYDRDTHGFYRCGAQRHEAHMATCDFAAVLHELDAEWSRAEVDRAHAEALRDIAGSPWPPLPHISPRWDTPLLNTREVMMRAIDAAVQADSTRLSYCSPVATEGFTDPELGVAAGPSRPLPNGQHFVEVHIQRQKEPKTPRPVPPGETKR